MSCEHDKRCRSMFARNGCWACELESTQAEVERLRVEAADAQNKWWHVCQLLGIPADSSEGSFRDALRVLKQEVSDGM